jgi:tetratricopeptide (TPR) repeat protein
MTVATLLPACQDLPVRPLPPSASDVVLLKSARLCDTKTAFLKSRQNVPLQQEPWGSGEEIHIPADRSESGSDESFFFDQDGRLVGALFVFPGGRNLKAHPVLVRTLSELKPTVEFYVSLAQVQDLGDLQASTLYMTGDEKSTTQYVITGEVYSSTLLLASMSIDPYSTLLSPYRKEFLARLGRGGKSKGAGMEDKEPFASSQQFARGETAQLGYCGAREYDIAADAYRKTVASGFSDKTKLSEAHHKLGLALKGKGQLEQARDAMQQSLAILPSRPEVLNNLGDVYWELGDRPKATAAFEKAVTLMPNYPLARFNLAKAYETINVKRAITEYETYLALVDGVPEEKQRMAQAQKRVTELSRP